MEWSVSCAGTRTNLELLCTAHEWTTRDHKCSVDILTRRPELGRSLSNRSGQCGGGLTLSSKHRVVPPRCGTPPYDRQQSGGLALAAP